MRVMLIHPRIFLGGAENLVIQLAYNLKQLGHQTKIVTLYTNFTNMSEIAKKVDYIIPNKKLTQWCAKSKFACIFLALPLLYYLIRKHINEVDILNPHHGPAYWLTAFFYKKKPIIWNCSEPPIPVSWKLIKKVGYFDFLSSKVANSRVEKFIVKNRINKIIVLDKKNQRAIRARYNRNSTILNAGVDTDFYNKNDFLKDSHYKNNFVLLTVGQLTPQKNQIVSIKALKLVLNKIPIAKLILVGQGPLEDYLKSEAKKLGIEGKVDFAGSVSDSELRKFYHISQVVLFPALNQTWGLTPFEALATKTIAIVSNDCGAAEVIHRENIGVVTEPTAEKFAEAILKIYFNQAPYQEMVQRGFNYVKAKMSWKEYAHRWIKAISEESQTYSL